MTSEIIIYLFFGIITFTFIYMVIQKRKENKITKEVNEALKEAHRLLKKQYSNKKRKIEATKDKLKN